MRKTPTTLDISILPPSLLPYLERARIYDSNCSEAARTLYIEGELKAYLKIGGAGKLASEQIMTTYLHSHGLAPKVLEYIRSAEHDFLLTDALDGEDGISERHIGFPKRLAAVFGESLRLIHQLPKTFAHSCCKR